MTVDTYFRQESNLQSVENIFDRAKHIQIKSFLNRIGVITDGHNFCCCPIHKEKTPSFKIYPETNSFHCFGCNAGGDIINLAELILNCNPLEASRYILNESDSTGTPTPELDRKPAERTITEASDRSLNYQVYQTIFEATVLTRKGKQYLQSRKLDEDVITYQLAFTKSLDSVESEDSEYCDTAEKLFSYLVKEHTPEILQNAGVLSRSGKLIFPEECILFFHFNPDAQRIEYISTRNLGNCQYKSTKLAGIPFHYWETWNDTGETPEIFLFEGIFDAVSFYQIFSKPDLSEHKLISTCGKPNRDLLTELKRKYPRSEINLCFDNDNSGTETVHKLRKDFPELNYFDVAGIDQNAKDWNECL